jgi:biotin carboxyl carrier protein
VVDERGARNSAQDRAEDATRERFEVTPLGNGRYQVSDGTRQRLAYAAGPPTARWVFIDGRTFVIDVTGGADGKVRRTQDDEIGLASPMPATVASIHVSEGQAVSRGDLLVMLEAMKMEMPIKAPRDGRIRKVACTQGELVQPGVPLVELE